VRGKEILDIMRVKPGCVITDVARPLDLPASDVAKRPDVLVIESGEIDLPTKVKGLKSIGLPPNVIYACLAETIVLALEGRFEVFTVGRDTEWEKVKEIYKLGLKHGMKLAAISGVNGVFSDEDIAKVVARAQKSAPDLERRFCQARAGASAKSSGKEESSDASQGVAKEISRGVIREESCRCRHRHTGQEASRSKASCEEIHATQEGGSAR
jgi:hypothetical protein